MISNEFKELENLSKEEKELALKILSEYSNKGSSDTYTELLISDYEEIPVDIDTFLDDPKYLGKGLTDEEGRKTVFPYWRELLKKVFPDPLLPTQYNTLALTGAIGLGKSFEAVLCCLYELYRMLCLKDPYLHYGLQPIDKITFALMNITLDAAHGVAWDKLQQLVQSSEWFLQHGTVSKSLNPQWSPSKKIELICGSQNRHIIGRALFFCFTDEISFQPNQDINKQKEKAKSLVNAASARMQSRFMKGEKNPTLLVLASSKRTEQSFMETFIEGKKKRESKTTLVVDEPQWIIRTDKDSPKKFKVAVGSKFLSSEVLPLDISEEDCNKVRNRGYQIIEVPMGYYENFIEDIDIALTDIAGISTSNSNRYISGPRIAAVETSTYQNAFTKEIIEVGNAKEDTAQYSDFFDITRIPESVRYKPLYVHMDMSVSGDKTGIGGVFIKGKMPPKENQSSSKDLFFTLGFNVSVKAPRGYQVSFEKNRQFIRWLKSQGFNVKGVSCDTYQSYDLLQALSAEGFNTSIISVDRVTDNICKPYQYLRSTMYEERMECYVSTLLKEEWVGLERDNNTGRIDHSPSGINCFTGDTKISLVDGRELTFLQLLEECNSGKINYVYSLNLKDNKLEPKPIRNVWCSGNNAKLLEITLDNGETIRCTPEHRFMLRDGNYVEAQYLHKDDSLMPLYRKYPSEGLSDYRMYYDPLSNRWYYEHRHFAQEIFDQKYLVHHKNCNPKDNTPTNLIWMSKSAHILEHTRLQTGAQSAAAKAKRSESLKKWHKENKDTVAYKERCKKAADAQRKHSTEEIAVNKKRQEDRKLLIEFRKLCKVLKRLALIKEIEETFNIKYAKLSKKERYSYTSKLMHIKHDFSKAKEALRAHNESVKVLSRSTEERQKMSVAQREYAKLHPYTKERLAKMSESSSNSRWYNNGVVEKFIKIGDTIPSGFVKGRINHKVVSIKELSYTADVYDIEVEDNHNFALSAGVFVHNSKDSSDAICGAMWNASQHADEFAIEYGEDLAAVVKVANNAPDTNPQQITLDFEEELKNVFAGLPQKAVKVDSKSLDFGAGPAIPVTNGYISEGIMVW